MSLPDTHRLREQIVQAYSPSIGATPLAAYGRIPFPGTLTKIGVVTQGAITTNNCAITVAVNGTHQAVLDFTILVAGAAAGELVDQAPGGNIYVNEDDVISFTPSGASGASIGAEFFVALRDTQ